MDAKITRYGQWKLAEVYNHGTNRTTMVYEINKSRDLKKRKGNHI